MKKETKFNGVAMIQRRMIFFLSSDKWYFFYLLFPFIPFFAQIRFLIWVLYLYLITSLGKKGKLDNSLGKLE